MERRKKPYLIQQWIHAEFNSTQRHCAIGARKALHTARALQEVRAVAGQHAHVLAGGSRTLELLARSHLANRRERQSVDFSLVVMSKPVIYTMTTDPKLRCCLKLTLIGGWPVALRCCVKFTLIGGWPVALRCCYVKFTLMGGWPVTLRWR